MSPDRRTFLKHSGVALGAVAAGSCAPDSSTSRPDTRTSRLDPDLLRAVAPIVLPTELGVDGIEAAVVSFERWAESYEPVAELNHGYGTSEIRYAPPDPTPAWQAQLEALDVEAMKRWGSGFASLDTSVRRTLLEGQRIDSGGGMPSPLAADHVAVALMAHWFASPDATDRCYSRRIGVRICRGIDTAPAQPETL